MKINDNKVDEGITLKEIILNIQDWFKYLFSKWYISVSAALIGGLFGFFYSKFSEPTYTATTTFVLEAGEKSGGLGQYAGVAAMVGIDLGGSSSGIFQGDNLLELYKSRKMIEATLLIPSNSDSSRLLIDCYLDANKVKENWKKQSPKLLEIDFKNENLVSLKRSRDSILQRVVIDINKNNLRVVKPNTKLSIVKVDVQSTDEVFSKEFNEALVAQVNDFYVTTKTKKSLDNIEILQQKTDSVRAVMNGDIVTAAVIMDETPNLNPTRQAKRLVSYSTITIFCRDK
ncbi:lipopolysaccharide biosynthesis protein [Sphingobacterium sp. SG20118]|uniref:lipopolysaccharide biosynthesis protein n=1 Tax=Sphingobacterium sp. SG20118 TaxID=3367156 RepID=UPI0037DFC7F0